MTAGSGDAAMLRQAYAALHDLRTRLERAERAATEPVAIVGMGCRFPGGADGPDAFWRLLADGVDAISDVPPERWDARAYYDPDQAAPGKISTMSGGFLPRVDCFDAAFFGISPREAARMDPQQRLLCEVAWEALEHAGVAGDSLRGTQTGVFVGLSTADYARLNLRWDDPAAVDAYFSTGNSPAVAAGRLAYFLGCHGPALTVDTACSSSLVAVHLAVRSLRANESSLALAGGVNLILSPELSINFSRAGMLAPDGRCKTFDASADGYGRAEGCGVVVLERLSDARANGHRVLAVVRGSAVNQDGRSAGLTAPNGPAQEALVRRALAEARVAPELVTYVEAHGTGTALGDPIEVRALVAALAPGRSAESTLHLGSVKTNIGHTEAAAGVAGLIKVVLAMGHRTIPPHLHFQSLNPGIPPPPFPLVVPSRCVAWEGAAGRRIAGVSSFGFSGTNAHVVVEEDAPALEAPMGRAAPDRSMHLIAISAQSAAALAELAARHAAAIGEPLADWAFTAGAGRAHHPYRIAVVVGSAHEAAAALRAAREGATGAVMRGHVAPGIVPRVAFLCARDSAIVLADLWRSWGIEPVAVLAFDGGENVATRIAGDQIPVVRCGTDDRAGGMRELSALGCDAFVEIGHDAPRDWPALLTTLGELYVRGAEVKWPEVWRGVSCRRVVIPTYPFERVRHWIEPAAAAGRVDGSTRHGLTPPEVPVSLDAMPMLRDSGGLAHVGILLELVVAASEDVHDHHRVEIIDVAFQHALHAAEPRAVQVVKTRDSFELRSRGIADRDTTLHVRGEIRRLPAGEALVPAVDLAAIRARCARPMAAGEIYDTLEHRGFPLGPSVRWLDVCACGDGEALASLRAPRPEEDGPFALGAHPGVIEACAQLVYATLPLDERGRFMLAAWDRLVLDRAIGPAVWAHARRLREPTGDGVQAELRLYDDAGRVVLAVGGAWFRRIDAVVVPLPPDRAWTERVIVAEPGVLESIAFGPTPRRTPAPGEVEIEVRAASLQFRDVLVALGLLAGNADSLGADCAGVVARVGTAVEDLHVGDEVVALASGALARFVTTDARLVARKPARLSWAEAATLPVPFLTAWLALHDEAGTARGERMLIHHAAGGVGLAALAVARRAGAIVLATASRPKHAFLAEIGIEQPMDSRTLEYVHTVRERTAGRGVDVIVGALAGDAVAANLELLAPGGRLVQIGKRDLPDEARVAAARPDVRYLPFDLDRLAQDEPERVQRALRDVVKAIENGDLEPLAHELFPAAAAGRAFAAMAGGRHTGRLIVSMEEAPLASVEIVQWRVHPSEGRLAEGPFTVLARNAYGPALSALLADAGARVATEFGRGVIDLRALAVAPIAQATATTIARDWEELCGGLLSLVRDVSAITPPVKLWLVTSGAMEGEAVQAALWGLAAVLAVEHPEVMCVCLDLEPGASAADAAAAVLTELRASDGATRVSYRGGQRRVAHLEPVTLPATAPVLRPDATYLVTGGTGGVGLALAGRLVERGARHLVLASRHAAASDATRALASRGADVHVVTADVGLEADVARLLDEIARTMPPLGGIIHAAGVLQDGLLARQSIDEFMTTFPAKVRGAFLLHRMTRALPIDLFVMCSSVTAQLGLAGAGSYAAGNAFLDALALHRRSLGLAATSVAWGAWDGVGMAAGSGRGSTLLQQHGIAAFREAEGLEAFDRVLSAGLPYAVVMARDADRPERAPRAVASDAADGMDVARVVQRIVASVLGYDPSHAVDTRRPLSELGLDSIGAVELRNSLSAAMGRKLPATLAFNYPTVTALVEFLAPVPAATAAAAPARASTVTDLELLSEEEAEALLERKLAARPDAGLASSGRNRE